MRIDRYGAILCDLDGCLIAGERALPGARRLIDLAGERLWILSNNSSDTPASLSVKLRRLGLDAAPQRMILAGAAMIDRLADERPGCGVALYASSALQAHAAARGLALTGDDPDVVLLCRDERFDYGALNRIVRLVSRGARLIVANGDNRHPGEDGYPVAETGALLAALRYVLPDMAFDIVGKPEAALYDMALQRIGLPRDQVIAIGDNADTDFEGARRYGLSCVLIGGASPTRPANLDVMLAQDC